ncbi:MAG: AAA family ATPase [Anaerolineales bacterium]|nr:AAA family ATPase [Anaerolineales bacterium]
MSQRITDDLDALLSVLPPHIANAVREANNSSNLLEVIMDLGRVPTARFLEGEIVLSDKEVTHADIQFVDAGVGDFDADNRAGMERTLHRISAIRNRRGDIVGLTCRVGRAVYGTTEILKDLIESGKSLLILGRPGVGKTTMLREAARILADNKRVVIVDTSNEIGGDGDVPHPAVGRARRMQVSLPSLQHEVMIEAVENHNPEVIVIDEIGRELEAAAARTIAERGVQLIGTAHGNSLENLLLNPTLSDLVGGIESVTLSDEEARRRGTQKTVLERRSPPTFDVLIEIQTRDRMAVHPDVAEAVDSMLRGNPLLPEVRSRDEHGEIRIEKAKRPTMSRRDPQGLRRASGDSQPEYQRQPAAAERTAPERNVADEPPLSREQREVVRVFPYGVARNRLIQAAKRLGVPILIENDIGQAQVVMTLRTHFRKRPKPIVDAEQRGTPIYVLRSNTISQMEAFLSGLFNLSPSGPRVQSEDEAMYLTQGAIDAVLNGERWVELAPASSYVRRLQHQMARQANLHSYSFGKEPNRRVRIYRE